MNITELEQYKIVKCSNHHELEADVNNLIRSGWIPQGGVSVSGKSEYYLSYSQAMVKGVNND